MQLIERLVILLAAAAAAALVGVAEANSLRIIHKFSDEARELGILPRPWPAKGSLDYYKALHRHDLSRHARRQLQTSSGSGNLDLMQGNYSENLGAAFGGIHYSIVDIGTPNVTFLVALDTGSDLFWVPCDCQQCESKKFAELRIDLANFNSNLSSSSKAVTCGDSLCESRGKLCSQAAEVCPYQVNYLSANTSTSGKLLQEVIYLRDPASMQVVKAPIVFGCGQVQTGLFLRGGAPNGLLGLGPGPLSLPSLLANDGLIKDSFSMCFDIDNSGRLMFGDQGASNQQTTPFLSINGQQPAYFISVEQIHVGTSTTTDSAFRALFDTGTTLTYLPAEVYTSVTTKFDSQVQLTRVRNKNLEPYEFCYKFEGNSGEFTAPEIEFAFRDGGKFTIRDPFLYLVDGDNGKKVVGICLAVLEGSVPIIGQNFMVGYRLSFDRERSRLGWAAANCYNFEDSVTSLAPGPRAEPRLNQSSSTNVRQDSPFLNPGEAAPGGRRPSSGAASPQMLPLVLLLVCIQALIAC